MEKKKYHFGKRESLCLKGIAIIMMMYHHCFMDGERFEGQEIVPFFLSIEDLMRTSNFCKLCVAIFVFISAYGMTMSIKKIHKDMNLTRQEFTNYIKVRYSHLMPGWLYIFVCCQLFCWIYANYQVERYSVYFPQNVIFFLLDALGVSDLFVTPTLVDTWWYMSFAHLIIITFPIFIILYKKVGSAELILLSILLPRMITVKYEPFENWILVIVLGIVFADHNVLEKMKEWKISKHVVWDKILKLALSITLLVIGYNLRENADIGFFYEFRHGILCILVIYVAQEFFITTKYLSYVLAFLGKHSMNIFLIHTLIRYSFFRDFTYSFKYPLVIISVLLGISLMVSILLEQVKKLLIHYKQLWKGVNDANKG